MTTCRLLPNPVTSDAWLPQAGGALRAEETQGGPASLQKEGGWQQRAASTSWASLGRQMKLIHSRGNHTHCPVKARVGWVPGAWGSVWEKPPTQSYFSLSPDHL